MTLVQAARAVNVPKKSLDDYLKICKLAKLLGYEFSDPNARIGVVRKFIAKERTQ